jgi:signal transduction histidine kinase
MEMDFMPIIPFLGVSVPESLVLYYIVLVLTGKKESPIFVIFLSLLTSLFSFSVRSIPMVFGIHSILQIIIMVIFLNLFFQLPWHAAIAVMILTSVILGLAEGIFVPFLAWAFSLNLQQIISDPLLRILFTLPHLLFLAVLTYIISKLKWRLPLIARVKDINCETDERTKKQFIRQTCLFALCLVQALMLVILNLSIHAYTSGVYPNFTLNFLIKISKLVLMFSSIATIFVVGYLLKVIQWKTKLETELHYARMRHNLNLRLQVERHDFNNHLTAIYGYIKAGHYTQAETYIENLYQTVRHIGSLLKIDPPELAAILSAKREEAKTQGVKFNWQVNIQSSTLPLSAEDLTHLTGNLLDNAMEAVKINCSPRVDFSLTCNKIGLELKVSNNCGPIPIKQNIFAAGFTTKDTKQHSGLGLSIIKQIIDSHDGQLKLKEPENYSGVEFVIYIPWKS